MPVYIAVEVARRELEGRLLLGLVAAERGYDVVLGKIPHQSLLSGELNGWRLPPGILHLKSIASSERIYERFDRLRASGTLITVQDEEHGLSARDDYGEFARLRFPENASPRIDRLMGWGPLDVEWFRSTRPDLAPRVAETGSPRIDLWRTDVIGCSETLNGAPGFILVASSSSPFDRNPFWVQLYNWRAGVFGVPFTGEPGNNEADFFDSWSDMFRYVKHLARAIRLLARSHPDRTIVVRPHHYEISGAWEAVIGDLPNVIVRADGPARAWVRDAAVLVHGGSTLAIEASVARRPVIAFSPEGFLADSPANRLGMLASDADELVDRVTAALDTGPHAALSRGDEEFLSSRLAALNGPLAADRIVDEWERMAPPSECSRLERVGRGAGPFSSVRRTLESVRRSLRLRESAESEAGPDKGPYAMEVEHKFPSLDVNALREDAERLSKHLGRFQNVEIVQIGEREVLLRAAGR